MQQPKQISLLLLVVLLVSTVPGCATLSEGECKTADWFSIGRQDGNNGRERARLYDHRKACAEYGVQPDSKNYYAGREAGLARYCTPSNGFNQGRAGKAYQNVCPVNTEPGFLFEYRQGKIIRDVDEDIQSLERTIDRQEKQLNDDKTTAKQADELRESLRRDYERLRYLNREVIRLERLHANGQYSPVLR